MNDASNIISVFGCKIPIALFVAIVGSVGTLLGGIIAAVLALTMNRQSNRQQNVRLKLQLQHEADQSNREREMALRRDVYLEAASEMAKAGYFIAKFGDLNLPLGEHEAMAKNFGAAMSKVHMVAGMEILTKAIEASNVFASINLELNLLRFSLLLNQKDISILQKSVENDIAQQQNLVARIGQLQTATPNHPDISALSTTFQEMETRIQQARKLLVELNDRTMKDHFNLSSVVFKRTLSFGAKLIEVNIAFRNELNFNLKGCEENYKTIVSQSQEQAVKEMDKYITEIGRILEEKKKGLHPHQAIPN